MASGRNRIRELRDRIVASDPGLGRLRMALGGVVAMGTALLVEWGFGLLLGVSGLSLLVGMLLGAVVAMMGSMGLAGQRPWPALRTAVFFPVAIGVGLVAGVAVGGRTDLMLGVFVVVMFLAVFVRRFGLPFFFYGFMGWMGYFFASFLHATLSMLPMLIADVAVAAAWVLALSITVLRQSPARTVRRMLGAFGARARSVAGSAADLLAADPDDTRRRQSLERRLHDRQMRLAECALMIEGTLGEDGSAPQGWPAAALRRQLVDAQITIDAVAGATQALVQEPDHDRVTAAAVADCARAFAAGDYGAARRLAAELEGDPDDARTAGAARRIAAAIADYVVLARRWYDQPEADADDHYEPQVMLMMGNLPGSAAVAREVPPRGARWNPLARLDLNTRQAVQVAIAGGLAILLGRLLSEQRYYWAVIAAFIAFTGTATRSETFIKASNRVIGTMVGLFAAAYLAELTAGHTSLVVLVILLSVFCGFYLIRLSYAFMIFFITIMVGQLYAVLGMFSTGLLVLRLEETAIGGAIGFLVALLVVPTSTRDTVRTARAGMLTALADLLDGLAGRIDPTRVPDSDGETEDHEAEDHEADDSSDDESGDETGDSSDDLPDDPDARLRLVEDKLRQLTLVAAPLSRPMVPGHDHRHTRLALRLFTAATTDARTLTTVIRQHPDAPLAFAAAAAELATAARGLAEPAPERPVDDIADALDEAEVALFETARPRAPRTEVLARPLAHLQRLLREMLEGTVGFDAALRPGTSDRRDTVRPTGRAVLTGLVTGTAALPDPAGTVTLIDAHGQGSGTARWDRDGSYRLTAPAGSYTLLVTASGCGPHARRLTLDEGVQRADVHLEPTARDARTEVPARA